MTQEWTPGADLSPCNSAEAEAGVLGSVLCDERLIDMCIEAGLTEDAFYTPVNRRIYRAYLWLNKKGHPIDAMSVIQAFKDRGQEEEIGGGKYMSDLIDQTPTSTHLAYYIKIVQDKWVLRRMEKDARQTIADARSGEVDPKDALATHIGRMVELSTPLLKRHRTKDQVWERIMSKVEKVREGEAIGMPAPWPLFNKFTGGAGFGGMTLIVGRSKTRKSYLAHQWGLHASVQSDMHMPGAYYPFEDGQEIALLRAACALAEYDFPAFRQGKALGDMTWGQVKDLVGKNARRVIDSPYSILAGRGRSRDQYRLEIARGVAEKGWKFVIFDAFKDMDKSGGVAQEEARLSQWMHDIAEEFDMAVLTVHHLLKNRGQNAGSKKDKWPERIIKEDARGSSQITDGARMIIALQCQLKRDQHSTNYYTHYVLDCIDYNYGQPAAIALDIDPASGLFVENTSIVPFSNWNDNDESDEEPWYERVINRRKGE